MKHLCIWFGMTGLGVMAPDMPAAQTQNPVRAAIETCMAFVATDGEFTFSPDWLVAEYSEKTLFGRGEIRIDRDLINLTLPVEIAADTRRDDTTGIVIDRQCLVKPVSARTIQRFAEDLDDYMPRAELTVGDIHIATSAHLGTLVAGAQAVDTSDSARRTDITDPDVIAFRTCEQDSIAVATKFHPPGSVLHWPWTTSVTRREGKPDGCE